MAAVVPAQALVPVGAASDIIVLEDKRRLLIDHLSRCIDGGVHVCHQSLKNGAVLVLDQVEALSTHRQHQGLRASARATWLVFSWDGQQHN